jgi:hypothetical protein
MSGIWNDPRALEAQETAIAAREARKRAKRLADQQESTRIASRIRAAYEERLEERPGLATTRPSGYRPPYPWMKS